MEGGASSARLKGGRGIIAILTVLLVALASIAVGYVLLAPERTVQGTVTDANGSPLDGATVSALDARVITNPDGGFQLTVRSWGRFVVQAEAEKYWTQKLWAGQDGEDDRLNFSLAEDQDCWVVTCMAYVHYLEGSNLRSLIMLESAWPEYLYIDDYAPGDEKALKPNGGGPVVDSGRYNATSYGMMLLVTISGVYWDQPGDCENCFAVVDSMWHSFPENISDYLDISDVPSPGSGQSSIIQVIGLGAEGGITAFNLEDWTLPSDLGVKVNVTILGEQFQTTLPVTYRATTMDYYWVQVTFGPATQENVTILSYRDGWMIHIWEMP